MGWRLLWVLIVCLCAAAVANGASSRRRASTRFNLRPLQSTLTGFLAEVKRTLSGGGSTATTDTHTRPFSKSQRIAIIGAGPAGMHMASQLKKAGYKPTILEKTQRVGGKSYTIYRTNDGTPCQLYKGKQRNPKCVPHDMGTCFMHNGYKRRLFGLFEEYGLSPPSVPPPRADFYEGVVWHPEKGYPYKHKGPLTFSLGIALSGKILIEEYGADPKTLTTSKVANKLMKAIKKYNKLHRKYFKKGPWLIPKVRPGKHILKELAKPFRQWLAEHGLAIMWSILAFGYSAQGYGYAAEVPTYYGMVWVTPTLMHGSAMSTLYLGSGTASKIVRGVTKFRKGLGMRLAWALAGTKTGFYADPTQTALLTVPDGWQRLWDNMLVQDKLDVKYGVNIKSIDRHLGDPNKPVDITWRDAEGVRHQEQYDWIIYTPHPTKDFSDVGVVKDVQDEEKTLFSALITYQITTTMYRAPPYKGVTDRAKNGFGAFWSKVIEDRRNNLEYAERYDSSTYGGDRETREYFGLQDRVAYQFSNKVEVPINTMPYEQSQEEVSAVHRKLLDKLTDEFSLRGINTTGLTFVKDAVNSRATGTSRLKAPQRTAQFAWSYFPHWNSPDKVFDLLDLQGKYKTWYSGSFASFESVLNVVDYNCRLLLKHLDVKCDWVK